MKTARQVRTHPTGQAIPLKGIKVHSTASNAGERLRDEGQARVIENNDSAPKDIKEMVVTPALAEQWLAKNTHNRNIRMPHVRGLAADMANGDWQWNGEAIKFAPDGTLIDGQHRLMAVTVADVPIKMLVIRGVEMEAQHTMDTGSKRTPGDMLKLRGEKHYNLLASGIRAAILWDQGVRMFHGSGSGSRGTVTNTQVLHYLEMHPEMRTYTEIAKRVTHHVPMPGSVIMTALKVLYEIDPEDAEHFFERLASDENQQSGDPIYALRRILLQPKDNSKISYSPSYKLAVLIKAWNKYRAGESVMVLKYRAGGANPESFPEPI